MLVPLVLISVLFSNMSILICEFLRLFELKKSKLLVHLFGQKWGSYFRLEYIGSKLILICNKNFSNIFLQIIYQIFSFTSVTFSLYNLNIDLFRANPMK